jgi:hypothetical protein
MRNTFVAQNGIQLAGTALVASSRSFQHRYSSTLHSLQTLVNTNVRVFVVISSASVLHQVLRAADELKLLEGNSVWIFWSFDCQFGECSMQEFPNMELAKRARLIGVTAPTMNNSFDVSWQHHVSGLIN